MAPVTFDAELRVYLEALARRVDVRLRLDDHALRAHFLSRLRELEQSAADVAAGVEAVEARFRAWSSEIGPLARHIETRSRAGAVLEPRAALELATRVIDVALGVGTEALLTADRLELEQILAELQRTRADELTTYALETYLVRAASAPELGPQLTPLGAAFLRLRGKDAIRWLLTLEVVQSTGRSDPWRACRELLEVAMSSAVIAPGDFHADSFRRLARMGVIGRLFEARSLIQLAIVRGWETTVRSVLGTTPWHHAIAAILEDDRTGIVPATAASIEAVVEQAKMIAHEVRNALVPVRHHIEALRGVVPAAQSARLDAAKRGVARVLKFAEEMVEANELIVEPATLCDLIGLTRDALGWLDGGERVHVVQGANVHVRVPRLQVTRAIANVIRNALQATRETEPVRVSFHLMAGGAVRLAVDDAGAGIAEDQRERVFDDGYTTRTDGSGYGLAHVRRVVTDALRGKVWCEASDEGGTRFVIELPDSIHEVP
jgi:signal transduction histidine kinase